MTKKIEELTKEQWAEIDAAAEQWIGIGTSTERCDRAKVEKALQWLYPNLLEEKCPEFRWFDGPKSAVEAFPEHREAVKQALYVSPLWYTWTIYRVVAAKVTQIEHDVPQELIDNFMLLMENVGIVALFDEVCICVERPTKVMLDAEGNLHGEHGPAMEYADGWKLYYWHGTSIPAEWIEDKANLPVETALTHENVEQRRIAAEIIGWDKVLEKLNPRVIDENPNPQIGTLLECDLPGAPEERFLKVRCATERDFVLPVPKRFTTALEANADTYEMTPEEFLAVQIRT